MDLKEKVKNLPNLPGVYLMKDSNGSIIYVGKSKNLKNRVSSYFYSSKSHSPKVEKLVKNLKDFEYILTDTEFEAFMLECKLIKDLKPRYNSLMKSPLSYTYIIINTNEEYSSMEVSNNYSENKDFLYFGPYTSKNIVERAVQGLKEHFKILCNNSSHFKTACLNYSLGLCLGMCLGNSKDLYQSILNRIISLLNGTDKSIIEELEQKMVSEAEKFNFETAAKYRDYISSVNSLISKAKVIDFTERNKNIVMIEHLNDFIIKLFLIKGNKVLFSKKINLNDINTKKLKETLCVEILTHFKDNKCIPSLVLSKEEIDEAQIIYSYLKNSHCKYIIITEECLESEGYTNIYDSLQKSLLITN